MIRLGTTKGLVFCSSCRFITDQVRISAGNTSRTHGLMSVHHDLVFSRFFNSILVMIVDPLAVMVFTTGKDVAYITALYSIIAVFLHKLISCIHMALIVPYRTGTFM